VLSQEHMQKMNKENLDMDVQSSLLELIERFPNGLGLPENLYVIGTVNMDETTHPFSRKVLDRANTIEFNEINLKGGLTHPLEQTLINKLDLPNSTLQPQYITMQDLLVKDPDASNEVANRLEELNEILSKAGCQIGYRIRDEAAFFMKYVKEINDESLNEEAGFERVVLQKILPRVQGSSYQIKVVLEDLLNEFVPESKLIKLDDDNYTTEMQSLIADKGPLAKKIGNMLIQFMEDGFTSFWAN